MPNMMMAATTMVNNNTGNTSITLTAGTATEIAMDNKVVSTDTDVLDADLANNGIKLKKTGWYLVWGSTNLKMNTSLGFVSFTSQMYLDPGGVGSPAAVSHAVGETCQLQYDAANSLVEVFATSGLTPVPIEVTTANSVLTIRGHVIYVYDDAFTDATTVAATSAKDGDSNGLGFAPGSAKGTSFIAATYLADATLP